MLLQDHLVENRFAKNQCRAIDAFGNETVLAAKKAILCESWCYSSFGEWSFGLRRQKKRENSPRTANTRYKNRRERTKNQIAPVVNKI